MSREHRTASVWMEECDVMDEGGRWIIDPLRKILQEIAGGTPLCIPKGRVYLQDWHREQMHHTMKGGAQGVETYSFITFQEPSSGTVRATQSLFSTKDLDGNVTFLTQ